MAETKNEQEIKQVEMAPVNYGPQQMLHVERDGKNFFVYFPVDTTYKEAYDAMLNVLQGVVELSKEAEKNLKEKESSGDADKEDEGSEG